VDRYVLLRRAESSNRHGLSYLPSSHPQASPQALSFSTLFVAGFSGLIGAADLAGGLGQREPMTVL
jgi:hypothetical protein